MHYHIRVYSPEYPLVTGSVWLTLNGAKLAFDKTVKTLCDLSGETIYGVERGIDSSESVRIVLTNGNVVNMYPCDALNCVDAKKRNTCYLYNRELHSVKITNDWFEDPVDTKMSVDGWVEVSKELYLDLRDMFIAGRGEVLKDLNTFLTKERRL